MDPAACHPELPLVIQNCRLPSRTAAYKMLYPPAGPNIT
jgi:hypothetical protein